MTKTCKSSIFILSLVLCIGLLATGCTKKRIYTEPVPPGAHVPAGASTPASSGAAATSAPGSGLADDGAASKEAAAGNEAAPPAQAEPAEPQSSRQGSDLPAEASAMEGVAGVLDDELIGFPMADGSSYDADKLVAGHRTLPLGSRVEVTNVATGKTVAVTIADRGPFEKDRVIDLSRAAASQLGVKDAAEVTLKVVGGVMTPSAASPAPVSKAEAVVQPTAAKPAAGQQKTALGEPFYVQVGAFEDEANARAVLNALIQQGLTGSRLVGGTGGMSRVQAGPYAGRAAAEEALSQLRADYPASFIVIPD